MGWTTLPTPFQVSESKRNRDLHLPAQSHPQGRTSISWWESAAGSFTNYWNIYVWWEVLHVYEGVVMGLVCVGMGAIHAGCEWKWEVLQVGGVEEGCWVCVMGDAGCPWFKNQNLSPSVPPPSQDVAYGSDLSS